MSNLTQPSTKSYWRC